MSVLINLLPDVVLQRRRDALVRKWATIGLIAWLAAVVVVSGAAFVYKAFQDNRLSTAQAEKKKLDADVNSEANKKFRAEALSVQLSLKALDELFNHQEKMSLINQSLAELTPKQVRLSSISIDNTGKLAISCTGGSYADAAKFIVSLKQSANNTIGKKVTFSDIAFSGASQGDKSVGFSVTATVNYPVQTDAGGSL